LFSVFDHFILNITGSLTMRSNAITGKIPEGIGTLVDLEYLNLSRMGLSGTIPAELTELKKMIELRLFENELSGALPELLSGLRELEVLNLRNNLFTGDIPPTYGMLTELLLFRIDGNANLTGQVYEEICDNGISNMRVDCGVSCSCCNNYDCKNQ